MTWLLAFLLCWAWPAFAQVTSMSSFDDIDDNATPSLRDFFLVTEQGGANPDTDASAAPSTVRLHVALNGGADNTNNYSARINVASGKSKYYSLTKDFTPRLGTFAFGVNVHLDSLPTATREWLNAREDDGASGTQRGCYLTVKTDGTVELKYGTTLVGTSSRRLTQKMCCDASSTTCDWRAGCTVDADCPTQCGAKAGKVCDATDHSGCYWAGIELIETVNSASSVTCDLWWDGNHEIAGTPLDRSTSGVLVRGIKNGWVGALGTEASALDMYLADFVTDDSDRAHYGYLAHLVPSRDGGLLNWSKDGNCGDAAHFYACIDDWLSGGAYDETSNGGNRILSGASSNEKTLEFSDSTPILTPRGDEKITAVGVTLVGSTSSGSGTREIRVKVMTCSSSTSCRDTLDYQTFTLSTNTSAFLWGQWIFPFAPSASGGTTLWTSSLIRSLGLNLRPTTNNSASSRLSAVQYLVRVEKTDTPLLLTLADHNIGTDDGFVVICPSGDSTNGGTAEVTCFAGKNAGDTCSEQSYCSWEADLKDRPVGGCGFNNDVCRTCSNRRTDTPTGAGFSCDCTNADCNLGGEIYKCQTGTCSGSPGVCSNNSQVPCNVATQSTDCDLGSCAFDATCVESCPGSVCPTHAGWGTYMASRVGANVIYRCYLGGESSAEFNTNRLMDVLNGNSESCTVELGSGTCACASNADCNTCSITTTLGCTSSTDCPSGETCQTGGTCTSGKCTASPSAVRTACQLPYAHCACRTITSGVCTAYRACTVKPCDYVPYLGAYNDIAWSQPTQRCRGSGAIGQTAPGGTCGSCAGTECATNSDCSGVSADSVCLGHYHGFSTKRTCVSSVGFKCSADAPPCRSTADCTVAGQTCSTNAPNDPKLEGFCQCGADHTTDAADTTCPADDNNDGIHDFACRSSVCRRKCGRCSTTTTKLCASNGDCPGGETCAANPGGTDADCQGTACLTTTPRVCKGVCDCPDSAKTCSTDADCTTGPATIRGFTRTYRGKCVSGHCTCNGPNNCRKDTTCPDSFASFLEGASHNGASEQMKKMRDTIAALSESDGRPLLIPVTLPNFGGRECFGTSVFSSYNSHYYIDGVNAHIRSEFPIYAEAEKPVGRLEPSVTHSPGDDVHFTPATSDIVGAAVSQRLSALGVCARTDSNGQPIAQGYCRNANGSWTSTACPASACSTGQSCVSRRCGCSCRTTQECINWFGASHTCSSGICKLSGTDSCTSIFGAGYTCTSGKCMNGASDACPATGDSCQIE